MSSFNNKTVLVTGGASGIGRLMGIKALEAGAANLVVWDIDEQAMQALKHEQKAYTDHIHTFHVDISDPQQIEKSSQEVLNRLGTIDILVNNAGVVTGKEFSKQSKEEIQQTIDINIAGVMHTTHAFLPAMIEQQSGHIVNISSAISLMANPGMSVYAGSKWAVTGWSESLRLELEAINKNLRVTTVQPSYINTGMFEGVKAPLLTPMLEPNAIAEAIIKAVKKNKIVLRKPFMVKLTPFLKGILPGRLFDFIAGRLFKVYASMNSFKGRTSND
ncbi:MAG: SDR family oxidoreductase [Balneolaceae bacterium]|nr:SDR family oxidoreductase [Balneolaceae bacterium]